MPRTQNFVIAVMGKDPNHWTQTYPVHGVPIIFVKFRTINMGENAGEDELGRYTGVYVRVSDCVKLHDITPSNCDPYVMEFLTVDEHD